MSRSYYELRTYDFVSAAARTRFGSFVEDALIPAYGRMGIGPVGAFAGVYGPDNAKLFLLIPHNSIGSVADSADRLLADDELVHLGRAVLETDLDHPSYTRIESRLLHAFTEMPNLELPDNNLARTGRIFEIRIYASHSLVAAAKKRRMFNEGGEIEIFRKTGLSPVLFGETIIGPGMPSLLYMLTFDGMGHRDEAWETFKNDPEWEALRSDPQYADTVSAITDMILAPTSFSQM